MPSARPVPALTDADLERFWSRIDVSANGCWLWTGRVGDQGYGEFKLHRDGRRRLLRAHRVAWQEWGGVPTVSDLDHMCHNADSSCPGGGGCLHRRCVNPRHLTPTLPGDNARRGRARITTCGKCGGPYDLRWASGARDCRACWLERCRRGGKAYRDRQPKRVRKPKPLPARLVTRAWRENDLWDEARDPANVVYVLEGVT